MHLIDSINAKLSKAFPGSKVSISDNSPAHSNHFVASQASHVHIEIISEHFAGMSPLNRHKKIYEALKEEILLLHAISISALTPEEV
jgi:stress-induced morphogen